MVILVLEWHIWKLKEEIIWQQKKNDNRRELAFLLNVENFEKSCMDIQLKYWCKEISEIQVAVTGKI